MNGLIENSEILENPVFDSIFKSTKTELKKIFPNHNIGRIGIEYEGIVREMLPEDNCKVYKFTDISIITIKTQIQKRNDN